jgi:hypothetical protein
VVRPAPFLWGGIGIGDDVGAGAIVGDTVDDIVGNIMGGIVGNIVAIAVTPFLRTTPSMRE